MGVSGSFRGTLGGVLLSRSLGQALTGASWVGSFSVDVHVRL